MSDSLDSETACCYDDGRLKKVWHIVTRVVVVVFVVLWSLTTAHEVASHRDDGMCGHSDDGTAHSECSCICACHAAVEPLFNPDYCPLERITFVVFEYVTLLGTAIPADIFRPPLVNS